MLDLSLANSLFKAIPHDSHVLLVGDVDQLPSVGAGDILRDLIASGVTAVVRLDSHFPPGGRLADHSQRAPHQSGTVCRKRPKKPQDFFLFVKEEPAGSGRTADRHRRAAAYRRNSACDPLDDVQVLAPMYNGTLGVNQLEPRPCRQRSIRRARKPNDALAGASSAVGDKVMQTVNNYDKNGLQRRHRPHHGHRHPVQQTITVSIDGAPVVYDFLETDELVHAYAISVHKSQGAEYPCIVMPVVTQHYMMLQRNLLIHGRDPGQEAGHPRRHAQSAGHRRQEQQGRRAAHGA